MPTLLALSPLARLFDGPAWLIVLQALFHASAAFLLYRFARRHASNGVALALTAAFLFSRRAHGAATSVFYIESAEPMLIFGALIARESRRLIVYWVLVVLALGCKEDVALYVAAFGVVVAVVERDRRDRHRHDGARRRLARRGARIRDPVLARPVRARFGESVPRRTIRRPDRCGGATGLDGDARPHRDGRERHRICVPARPSLGGDRASGDAAEPGGRTRHVAGGAARPLLVADPAVALRRGGHRRRPISERRATLFRVAGDHDGFRSRSCSSRSSICPCRAPSPAHHGDSRRRRGKFCDNWNPFLATRASSPNRI